MQLTTTTTSTPSPVTASPATASLLRAGLAFRLLPLLMLAAGFASVGCATENKVLQGPRFALSYPDFWKIDKVAKTDGEATKVTIGKYSSTVINDGAGQTDGSNYEASQADVEVRIYASAAPADATSSPTKLAAELAAKDPDLNMSQQGLVPEQPMECGADFKRKYTLLKAEHETLDVASRPGHRLIIVGAVGDGTLLGVVSRVPFEQDRGLYCHNLSNMRTQLQNLLDGLTVVAAPAPAGGAPASGTPPPPAQGAPSPSGAPVDDKGGNKPPG